MKPKLLIATINSATKNGMKSYLASILSRYIDIDAYLVNQITPEIIKKYDLILFSSESAKDSLTFTLESDIKHLVSNRTFNHTYLHKILALPPGVSVYLVNDSRQSSETVIEQLKLLGLKQYNFIPYYPECDEPDLNIQYAVTMGESKLVPSHINTVIDMGNRIVDISTIIEIVSYFSLPFSLVNEITKNYINHIIQVIKLTNSQLNEAMNTKILTQSIVNNVSTGLCLIDKNGYIKLVNQSFVNMIALPGGHLVDTRLNIHLQKYNLSFDWKTQKNNSFLLKNPKDEIIKLTIQEIEDNKHKSQFLIHSDIDESQDIKSANNIQYMINNYSAELTFSDYITIDVKSKELIETAKRISLTDFPVFIQGENGTGKSVLAQAIHNNSKRSSHPFMSVNISSTPHEILESEFLGYEKESENIEASEENPGIFELANRGTLYLEGIHDLSYNMQCVLERFFEKKVVRRIGGHKDIPVDVRIITSSPVDLYSKVISGEFREDLFYNLNIVSLETIPIRNRRADIPFHFNNSLKNAFNNPDVTMDSLCSDSLSNFLMSYSWPGNVKEINNLCKYLSCICTHNKLIMKDLPGYMKNHIKEGQQKLSTLENRILRIISQNPKIGRAKIQHQLAAQEIEITEGKIRNILHTLSDMNLIKINRTKGGCEITEEGELNLY